MSFEKLWLPYAQMKTVPDPLRAVRTSGTTIHLDDGRALVDGIASWWTACHGYNHPHIGAAVSQQLSAMPHIMLGGLVHEPVERLTERLAAKLPGDLDYCFYSESGSIAVEVAMKMALQYWLNRGVGAKHQFLSFHSAYHGDSLGAMSICDPAEGMHSKFTGALLPQVNREFPDTARQLAELDEYLAENARTLAAVVVEPLVQAAGGFVFHSPESLRRMTELARRHDLLVVFDEIATGFGRTGSMFACEQATVTPDIITLSKALTGGTLPLAVTVARRHVFEAFLSNDFESALMHGPTYCGNPLACAAANASLDLFESEPRLAQVAVIESQLQAELAKCAALPGVSDVRVMGAIGVVELARAPNLAILRRMFVDCGVWIRPFGKTVYLMPALTIRSDDLSLLTQSIYSVLAEYLGN